MDLKKDSSIFEEALVRQHQQESPYQFTLELGLIIALLFGSFMIAINNLNYNTLFLDEAIYAVVGEDVLQGIFTRNAMSFQFGSYLYPAISALLDRAGGTTAMRLASAILMCLASIFIYLTTRNLFGRNASLFSMMLFSFNGIVLNLSQLAVYDALALPFLATSLYFLVVATKSERHQKLYLITSSSYAVLFTLSKYVGLIYLPALFLTACVLFGLKGTSLRRTLLTLTIFFVIPTILSLGLYAGYYRDELIQVFREQGFDPAPMALILRTVVQNIGFIVLLGLAGLVFLIKALASSRYDGTSLSFSNRQSQWNLTSLSVSRRVLFFVVAAFLLCAWLAAPLQQILTGNIRSLWKNCAYSLVFFSPLAGYGISAFIASLRYRNRIQNLVTVLLLCLSIVYFSDQALDSNWVFHQSWPNTQGTINYLRASGLDENSRVLAEGMDIYEYYFDFGSNDRQIWNSFWHTEFNGGAEREGAFIAIRNRALDYVIIDDYYLPGIREQVILALTEAGYVLGYQEKQTLRTGDSILLQVFAPGERETR